MADAFIAVDWGTTNRRCFLIEQGVATRTERDALGAAALCADRYPDEIAAIRARFGDLPMLLAGMVGSNVGWQATPYVAVPAGIAELAGALCPVADRAWIVPGLSLCSDGRADVMRGEEVQLLGALAAGLAPRDGLLCQPGTHCKWAMMRDGAVAGFVTAMTGELFALLRAGGLLARQIAGDTVDGADFRAGVREGARRDLAASLFAIRARGVLGLGDDGSAASFTSGLLIGADVVARIEGVSDEIPVLADAALGALYVAAIATLGGRARMVDSHIAFVAGISQIWKHIA